MSVNVLEHSLSNQAKRCSLVAKEVMSNLTFEALSKALPEEEQSKISRVIITGCGDSWLAGVAMAPVFESVAGVRTDAMPCIEFSRHLNSRELGAEPGDPLVVGVSISGSVTRLAEALERANHYGANTLQVTNTADSRCGKLAKHVLVMGLPKVVVDQSGTNKLNYGGEIYSPGANSYMGSMLSLCSLALYMGRMRGRITEEEFEECREEILSYIGSVQTRLETFDLRAREIAKSWSKLRGYDFIGDYADYATAFFGSAKALECFGGNTTYDDSEDWNHINFFLREPETIGRVIIINEDTPSFSRLMTTLQAIESLESPCIVITNADRNLFPKNMEVFTFPKAKHFWLSPLMEHWPFSLVADQIATELGVHHFRRNIENYDNLEIGRDRLGSGTEIRIV